MKEVENFFNTYVTNILNGNDITIEPKRLVNLKDLTGNAKMNALKKSIEKHPENLIFYLNDKELDVTTRSILINYYLYEELSELIKKLCQNPELWLQTNTFLRSLLDENVIIKISKGITQSLENFHDKKEIENGVAKQFLEYYTKSKHLNFLLNNADFCTLANKWYGYAKEYDCSFIYDYPYFDIIKNCTSPDNLKNLEQQFINGDVTSDDLVRLKFNYKRLSPDFLASITNDFFKTVKTFKEVAPGKHTKMEDKPDAILNQIIENFTDKDIYNLCLSTIKNRKEVVLLSKTYSSLFSANQRKKIYDILYSQNKNILLSALVNTSGNYYIEYLTLKDLDTIYSLLTPDSIKGLSLWSKLNDEQFEYFFKKYEKNYLHKNLKMLSIEEYKKLFSKINERVAKKIADMITNDLIKRCQEENDISFFLGRGSSYFKKDNIQKIYTNLKPLLIADIHFFRNLWPSIKECFTDKEFSEIIDFLLREKCYTEAYWLVKLEERCENKYPDIIDGLLLYVEQTHDISALYISHITDEFNDYEMVKLFNIFLDIDRELIFRYDFPKNPKHKRYIKDYFVKNYKKYSLKNQLVYIKYLDVSLKDNMDIINYIIDRVYNTNIKRLGIFKQMADYIWEAVIKRAGFHQEKLIKYMLNAKDEELALMKDIIEGNKFLRDINALRENTLFKLSGYELDGLKDCFKLCALYKKSNTSVELFCKKYGITPVSGFDEALRIIGTIDAQELAEITETKALAAKKFYYNLSTVAFKLIDGTLSMEEYFTTNTYKFKNQKLINLMSVYKTRENTNKFALRFIDYIVGIIDKKGYLPKSVLEFLSFGNDKLTDILQKNIKGNLMLPRDKDYYIKYNRMQKFLIANTKSYFRNGLLMEFQINGIRYVVDDDAIDKSYIYLRKNNYCVSQDSMLMATRQVAMGLIDVSKETNAYKETLVSSIADTVTECHTLEEYIKMQEQKGPKLNKAILFDEDSN